MIDIVLWVGGVELNIPSIFPIVDASERDGPIVQMMFVLRGDWQLRIESMGISLLSWFIRREPFSAGL
jgi:hypothetical protein